MDNNQSINNDNNNERTKKQLLKILKYYDRLYYVSIFINLLILISILLEIVFIFVIKNQYTIALVSLVISFFLAVISFCMKFVFNNAVSKLLLYLVDKEDNRNKNIVDNLVHISSVLKLFENKVTDNEALIQILQLFDYSSVKKEKIQVVEKKEIETSEPLKEQEKKEEKDIYNIQRVLK